MKSGKGISWLPTRTRFSRKAISETGTSHFSAAKATRRSLIWRAAS